MRIVAISDTHISSETESLPEELYKVFRNADMVIHAGDLTEFMVLKKIKEFCPEVKAVFGNMDSSEVRSKLPQKEIIQVGNFKVGIMHGWGPPDGLISLIKKNFESKKVDIIIFGHSHFPYERNYEGVIYFNPGSPTDKIFAPFNSYGIIEITETIKTKIIKL